MASKPHPVFEKNILCNQSVAYICNRLIADMRRDVFQAIADPTRREIIGLLATKALTPTDVADAFDISRQAISKHMQILAECGLLVVSRQGRERLYEARLEPLNEVKNWVEQYHQYLDQKMDALDRYLDHLQKQRKNGKKK